jgi:hypothetical protein
MKCLLLSNLLWVSDSSREEFPVIEGNELRGLHVSLAARGIARLRRFAVLCLQLFHTSLRKSGELHAERRLFGLMAVGNEACDQVDQEVDGAAMTRMLESLRCF